MVNLPTEGKGGDVCYKTLRNEAQLHSDAPLTPLLTRGYNTIRDGPLWRSDLRKIQCLLRRPLGRRVAYVMLASPAGYATGIPILYSYG